LAATESAIGEMSKENALVEPIVGETVTLFVAVESQVWEMLELFE
jgi:hypothetical protein